MVALLTNWRMSVDGEPLASKPTCSLAWWEATSVRMQTANQDLLLIVVKTVDWYTQECCRPARGSSVTAGTSTSSIRRRMRTSCSVCYTQEAVYNLRIHLNLVLISESILLETLSILTGSHLTFQTLSCKGSGSWQSWEPLCLSQPHERLAQWFSTSSSPPLQQVFVWIS